jgi:hypothetical protein
MNPIRRIRRIATVLAGALLAFAAASPAAFARIPLPGGLPGRPAELAPVPPVPPVSAVTRIVVVGGMPGWQIALIAAGAALLAAAAAVLADRALAGRRKPATAAA